MKQLYVCLIVFLLSACSKDKSEDTFKNGQEVQLMVDHRYGSRQDGLSLLPQQKQVSYSLSGFKDRKPGYIYQVKARFKKLANPPQDVADSWFEFIQVISEQRYNGNESFDIDLIQSIVPGGPFIAINKTTDHYQYTTLNLELTIANQTVKDQLAEIWKNQQDIIDSYVQHKQPLQPKWRFAKATVTHDPNNFGHAYLVQKIEFSPL